MAVALIVAAGRGERLGTDGPKAFALLAGRPMVAWSIDAFRQWAPDATVVVAVPPGWQPTTEAEKVTLFGCVTCEGGAERSLSVRAALAAAGDGPPEEPVLIHDGARPLVQSDLIARMASAVEGQSGADGAVAAVPVSDTIRVADKDARVTETPDRSTLWAMQTPQAFQRQTIERALAQEDTILAAATDDAALVEGLGGKIGLVRSSTDNIKVTTPVDLAVAELLLADRKGDGA